MELVIVFFKLYIYIFIDTHVYIQSIYLSIDLSIHPSIYLYLFLDVYIIVHLSPSSQPPTACHGVGVGLDADGGLKAPPVPLPREDATDQGLDPGRGLVPLADQATAMEEATDHLALGLREDTWEICLEHEQSITRIHGNSLGIYS